MYVYTPPADGASTPFTPSTPYQGSSGYSPKGMAEPDPSDPIFDAANEEGPPMTAAVATTLIPR